MIAYFFLFLVSFLASTIFPFSSELTLLSLLNTKNYSSFVLIGVASGGNILGSVFNWILGFYFLKYISEKWFPFKKTHIQSASKQFNKFGLWSLLFAWMPVVGDPLTFIAGILKVNFTLFLILVSIGKISRYFFIYYLTNI
jgi:membrane protein YqaA with SNARE-associated domain